MYGATGYGIQPYGSTYPKVPAGGADVAISASESALNGAGRLAIFSIAKVASLLKAFVRDELKRFRISKEFLRFRPIKEFLRFRPKPSD